MKKVDNNSFIIRFKEIHGDRYNYSKVNMDKRDEKGRICIICPVHGEFWQNPYDHLKGCGCRKCYGNNKMSIDEFIEKARKVHGDKYEYSKVEYNGNKNKVIITCPIHGDFIQKPNDHLSGCGCPKCNNEYIPTTSEWIEMAKKVHGDRYDYSKVEYINAKTKVCIICKEHGEFWQRPNNHLNGCNCPHCNSNKRSLNEEYIESLLKENKINFSREKTFDWLKNKSHLYLDFYLNDFNVAIEYQGEQHYQPIDKFGGYNEFIKIKERDDKKFELCEQHGIKVFYLRGKKINIDSILEYINETTK